MREKIIVELVVIVGLIVYIYANVLLGGGF